jgi:electron transport complex protein RnfD
MATDYVTTPITTKGRFIFGIGCGVITVLIRFYGGFPEGVNYAILFMNMLTPLIDYYVRTKIYGQVRRHV